MKSVVSIGMCEREYGWKGWKIVQVSDYDEATLSDCCQDSVELLRLVVLQGSPKNAVPLCKRNIYIKPNAKESDMSHCISSLDLAHQLISVMQYQDVPGISWYL